MAVVGYIDEQITREIITIQTAAELLPGERFVISIKFTAVLNDQLHGFYRSSYLEDGNRK